MFGVLAFIFALYREYKMAWRHWHVLVIFVFVYAVIGHFLPYYSPYSKIDEYKQLFDAGYALIVILAFIVLSVHHKLSSNAIDKTPDSLPVTDKKLEGLAAQLRGAKLALFLVGIPSFLAVPFIAFGLIFAVGMSHSVDEKWRSAAFLAIPLVVCLIAGNVLLRRFRRIRREYQIQSDKCNHRIETDSKQSGC